MPLHTCTLILNFGPLSNEITLTIIALAISTDRWLIQFIIVIIQVSLTMSKQQEMNPKDKPNSLDFPYMQFSLENYVSIPHFLLSSCRYLYNINSLCLNKPNINMVLQQIILFS